jgi:hypothetical protein
MPASTITLSVGIVFAPTRLKESISSPSAPRSALIRINSRRTRIDLSQRLSVRPGYFPKSESTAGDINAIFHDLRFAFDNFSRVPRVCAKHRPLRGLLAGAECHFERQPSLPEIAPRHQIFW